MAQQGRRGRAIGPGQHVCFSLKAGNVFNVDDGREGQQTGPGSNCHCVLATPLYENDPSTNRIYECLMVVKSEMQKL